MIIKDKIKKSSIQSPFSKAVADIGRGAVSVDCELHADCADELLGDGSNPGDLWGFNIYPDGHIDFVSLLNIRPAVGNRSMEIKIQEIRDKIESIVGELLINDQ